MLPHVIRRRRGFSPVSQKGHSTGLSQPARFRWRLPRLGFGQEAQHGVLPASRQLADAPGQVLFPEGVLVKKVPLWTSTARIRRNDCRWAVGPHCGFLGDFNLQDIGRRGNGLGSRLSIQRMALEVHEHFSCITRIVHIRLSSDIGRARSRSGHFVRKIFLRKAPCFHRRPGAHNLELRPSGGGQAAPSVPSHLRSSRREVGRQLLAEDPQFPLRCSQCRAHCLLSSHGIAGKGPVRQPRVRRAAGSARHLCRRPARGRTMRCAVKAKQLPETLPRWRLGSRLQGEASLSQSKRRRWGTSLARWPQGHHLAAARLDLNGGLLPLTCTTSGEAVA
mmetsp:Transcript_40019/g.87379  ORF Transcript_40019/g.87379 Transcript_40019/m.87379 type:complete len:334 (-) Transcript_40019:98-1099(-)